MPGQTCWSDICSTAPASPAQGLEPAFSALCWVPNVPVLLAMDSQVRSSPAQYQVKHWQPDKWDEAIP